VIVGNVSYASVMDDVSRSCDISEKGNFDGLHNEVM
jgi:hypothetical protein